MTDKPVIPDAQIQSDWNQNDNTKADYIKNKPSIPSVQVQSDWNESDSSKADFIKNKPTIPAEQVNSDWDAESGKAQILNKPSIPTALADLTDDSTHRIVTDAEKTTWNGKSDFSGSYNDLTNKPTIPSVSANPSSTSQTLTAIEIDGVGYAVQGGSGGGAVDSVNGKTGVVVLDAEDVGALPDDTPLFSGSYNDLTDKPTIPDDLADLNDDSTHRLVTDTEKTTWNGKSDFSGSYNDLTNKPTIPAAQVNSDWSADSGVAQILNKPTLGTASALDVATSGDASTTQVVKGDDTRLTDSRNAADVYSWAKASTKPSYTASEVGAIPSTSKGANGGVAELDANGKVPSSQLPSYVDDTVEGYLYNGVFYSDSAHEHPITGETGKIYVELVSNKTYRWSGSAYVEISESLALGETSSTAYAGNKGKANADNISAIQGLIPSGASTSNKLATASDIPVITGKADKVSGATNGNLAGLDANGNLTDSGIASAIFPSGASSSNQLVTANQNTFTYQNSGQIDMNTLTIPGVHSVEVASRSAQHSPELYGFYQVYVSIANNNSAYVQQLAYHLNGNIYTRVCNNGTWSDWDKLIKQSNMEIIYRHEDFTSSTTLAYTGKSIPIKANKLYILQVNVVYSNGVPQSVAVSLSDTTLESWQVIESNGDGGHLTIVYLSASDANLYIWAKYSNVSQNDIWINGTVIS